ncbi:hypothetical protein Taro_035379 [Colocasia esculenta]|uniref:EF-hand domain-containing protein n=1 Tax=Colocasia esculenta TaxID=4460 RepID=A0A843VU96_COLES|nr:hypothetical protein [Colocasia esculenta]
MMMSKHEPVESFLNSLLAVESGLRRATEEVQARWPASGRGGGRVGFFCGHHGTSRPENRRQCPETLAPIETPSGGGVYTSEGPKEARGEGDGGSCVGCVEIPVRWSRLVDGFVRARPRTLKSGKKRLGLGGSCSDTLGLKVGCDGSHGRCGMEIPDKARAAAPLELFGCCVFDGLTQSLQIIDKSIRDSDAKPSETSVPSSSPFPFDYMKIITGIMEGRKEFVDGCLSNMRFARVGGLPGSLVGVTSAVKDGAAQKFTAGLLSTPLSNVERLRSTLSTVSLTELMEFVPQLRWSPKEHPDKRKLISVQNFFRYTESEGRRFFEELDRDGDGHVTLEDLEIAMRKRKLPQKYAREFLHRTRSHIFSKSIGWKQFLSLMEQKESKILGAYTTLCLSKSGTLQKSQILTSLESAGLPANEDNAVAMLRYLNADTKGSISYSHFRNFMLLLPSERLEEDPRSIWFEAATVVAVPPPVEIPAESVLKSALAGGLACALSTSLMHPVDTMKVRVLYNLRHYLSSASTKSFMFTNMLLTYQTRVQASTLSFPELVSKLPQIGVRGLYRGSLPAILGQFSSHGLRTGIYEASKLVLINIAPTLPEIQVTNDTYFTSLAMNIRFLGLSSSNICSEIVRERGGGFESLAGQNACAGPPRYFALKAESTILGTAVRIPCEVLKQRLQAGIFDNVGEAIVGTLHQDGVKGFFRGTGATLCREVPFYVAGMGLYAEAKKAARNLLKRDLEPWETIAVGALSGGLAAVVTTPFDVMKTRMMTAPQGLPVSMSMVAFSILRQEGPLGLFKGAVPRFFWIAPLGAMNFAGYELARKAMDKTEHMHGELREKRMSNSI